MRKALLAVGLASLTAVAALAVDTDSGRTPISRRSVLESMNAYRADHGLAPLREDPRLDSAAEDRVRDMEEMGYWSHQSPDGRSPFLTLKPRGYEFTNAGENLAAGFETTELLVASWMESKGHRDNILSPIFEDCGIAVIDGSTTGPATGRSIVVIFGRTDQPLKTVSVR